MEVNVTLLVINEKVAKNVIRKQILKKCSVLYRILSITDRKCLNLCGDGRGRGGEEGKGRRGRGRGGCSLGTEATIRPGN